MKLYILEQGDYEQRAITGVFDSPERAMAAAPGEWVSTVWCWYNRGPDNVPDIAHPTYWRSWEESKGDSIREWELTMQGHLAPSCPVREQRRTASGGWEYIYISEKEAQTLCNKAAV